MVIEKDKRIGCFEQPNGDVLRFYRRMGCKILGVEITEEEVGDNPPGLVLYPFWTDEEPFFERNKDLRPISEKEFSERVLNEMHKLMKTMYADYCG